MMTRAPERYNRLFRQTHKTFQIHHLALLMFIDYIMILVGTLQRIHRQHIRYKSGLDDTLIGIENLNSGYLTHHILDPKILVFIWKQLKMTWKKQHQNLNQYSQVYTSIMVIH